MELSSPSEALRTAVGHVLRRMPGPIDRLPAELHMERLWKDVKRQIRDDRDKPRIFGIGLSRTGTTSLGRALELLGYECFHFQRDGRIVDWPEFFVADAVIDTPVCVRFPSLYFAFPNSRFIYTTRDVSSWTSSMREFYRADSPRELQDLWKGEAYWRGEEGRKSGWEYHNALQYNIIQYSLYAQHDSWREAYQAYEERVEEFFDDKPADRLLRLNVTGGEGWRKLCDFLDCDRPDRPFPHLNTSDSAVHPIIGPARNE